MAPRRKSSRNSKGQKDGRDGTPKEDLSNDDPSSGRSSNSRELSEDKEGETSMSSNLPKEEVDEEEEDEENEDEEDDDESSSDEEAVPVVLNVNERSKRATAGNKMAALMASAEHEDEFYKTAYGGFEENEVDREFKSPVHSDEDEVDSDFDKEEEEDEPVSGGEDDGKPRRKKKKFNEPCRGLTADDILAKNKKWAMARLAGNLVAANTVDEKTQAQMLKEAEKTAKMNIESLKKYEEFELERKKKREKNTVRVFPPGPRVQVKMTANGTTLTMSEVKKFECERPRERNVCAVTGRPARYFDPLTGLPYSTAYAFKVIRDKYNKYLRTIRGNDEVTAYLKALKGLPTPPASPADGAFATVSATSSGPITSGPIVTPPKKTVPPSTSSVPSTSSPK